MKRVDCLGLFCPVPIMRIAEAIREVPEGGIVELVGDDPGIPEDLKAWCRGIGHELDFLGEAGGVVTARVRRRSRGAA